MSDLPVNPLVLIGIGSSFAFSGLFYHLYKEKERELKALKEIPVFRPDEDLVRVLNATPHRRLQYVAVEGQVQADGEPLTSQFIPRCYGVIQKIVTVEHWKYWDPSAAKWNSRIGFKKESNNSVPFSLISQDAYISDASVRVHNPLEASGCFLKRVYYKMRNAEEDLVNALLQTVGGEKPVSKEETEEMLHVGTTMTGFGEVVLERGQVMRLQAPRGGRKYILVPTDHNSFLDSHRSSATMWKVLSAFTGITGTVVLACVIHSLMNKRDERSN
ncbi:mitochondrial ubiquitin ligase activator of nfkb 1-A [Neolamprologus brichardi]|uniref:RING-type E3 ubiquitin transferase n=1 Tax=Neolamprologus brichardi TaxID=32507 RepID=A0A3Q4HXS6_NEOBR|nr:mitochondrial ubiquitin ligase activator of nfkb 1-A [Neolamprologus brichardi]XP_035768866.1 mitochondrial ubiquitin ligase activator of nfkb 1-A [Neolamprologus brichardi]